MAPEVVVFTKEALVKYDPTAKLVVYGGVIEAEEDSYEFIWTQVRQPGLLQSLFGGSVRCVGHVREREQMLVRQLVSCKVATTFFAMVLTTPLPALIQLR